jgi:ribosomal subunit interface protein
MPLKPNQVIVQGQHLDVGDALRGYVQDKLADTSTKFFSHSIQGNVHFAKEAGGFRADITLSVGNGIVLKASASEQDPYPAFDHANTRLTKQLKRYKDRLHDHHATRTEKDMSLLRVPANEYLLEDHEDRSVETGDAPVTLAEMPTHVETLTVAEAVMRMDLADLPAMLFKNAAHGRLNMVYRRKDGAVGWVDPQEI